jgi:hypothetical protein
MLSVSMTQVHRRSFNQGELSSGAWPAAGLYEMAVFAATFSRALEAVSAPVHTASEIDDRRAHLTSSGSIGSRR